MIPIIYDGAETAFISNGLGRLRDIIDCKVSEERNGVYECSFSYPLTGANFDLIQVGRIIGVTHDDTGDIQPFDIVSYTKPINGIVEFHCTHVSYRQSYFTILDKPTTNTLDAAFYQLKNNTIPANRLFTYETDMGSRTGYVGALNGVPRTVRSVLGGVEGSILDTFGGEYEWDKWKVILHSARGTVRPFSIRYGVNMLDYKEEFDIQGTYMRAIPFWKGGDDDVVFGLAVTADGATLTNRQECVPLDISDKFESRPTQDAVEEMGQSVINNLKPYIPTQTIHVEFVRLQDMGYTEFDALMQCGLCDTINVIFPDYNSSGQFKIVKTEWNVLADRYESMELGDLSVTLAEALGSSSGESSGKLDTEVIALASFITPTTGTLLDATLRRFGNVYSVTLTVQNSTSVSAGSNIFAGTLTEEAYRPAYYSTGGSYYGAHAISGSIGQTGAITVRNASSAAVTISGTNTVTVTITYIK